MVTVFKGVKETSKGKSYNRNVSNSMALGSLKDVCLVNWYSHC